MNKTKFTPGPWKLDKYFSLTDNDGRSIVFSCGLSIKGHIQDGVEETANAHLIAAAPELYEALEIIVRQYEIAGGTNWIIEKAKAALLKAEGTNT